MATDVTHETLTHSFTYAFTYDSDVLEMAKDAVKGHFEDYYFYQYDPDEYVLVFSDDMQVYGMGINAHDSNCIVFKRVSSSSTAHDSMTISGTITEVGAPPRVDDVALTGTINRDEKSYTWEIYYVLSGDINISNTSNLAYSSTGNLPRLQEGVTYYAFAAFFLAGLIICFKLFDRVFRRVY